MEHSGLSSLLTVYLKAAHASRACGDAAHGQSRVLPPGAQVVAPLCGFTAAMFVFYCGVPFVLRWGGAAVLNLSLLTSDLWAAAAQLAFFGAPSAAQSCCRLLSTLRLSRSTCP